MLGIPEGKFPGRIVCLKPLYTVDVSTIILVVNNNSAPYYDLFHCRADIQ